MNNDEQRAQLRKEIKSALANIHGGDNFAQAAEALLGVLGYHSERWADIPENPEEFVRASGAATGAQTSLTKSAKEFAECAKSLRMIFQITGEEVSGQHSLDTDAQKFEQGKTKSFLFIAAELPDGDHARGRYASFTREINKKFRIPVVVLYRVGDRLTAALAGHRPHKGDDSRDVLEMVTLIKDIRLQNPHHAHLDILADLSLPQCAKWMNENKQDKNFDGLQKAWLTKLDTEELNRNFYKKLQEWFEWAKDEAVFPATLPKDEHVVRLLTRLLFVWFVKEKGLIAEEWFNPAEMKAMLHNFNNGGGDYYRAVLQNLFFATLNAKIQNRGFSPQTKSGYLVPSLWRYRSLITNENRFVSLMGQTPFVNGGLFDCLDEGKHGGKRIDMFSDPDPKEYASVRRKAWANLCVPDKLFFDKTRGLIPLFAHYKFTVEENTPVEQDVALDPELLGKVFENLLNWIDRKQTGSYYTPRVIVDYMADESLIAAIADKCAPPEERESTSAQLRGLLDYGNNYEASENRFDESEAETIVRAIADIKVLDPAVGSGAFPMGILHKLTLALKRLDPKNTLWETIQKERAQEKAKRAFDEHKDKESREDELLEINDTFDRYRDSDYGRKLYLIQNSIFGADIQPIACQIAKLRFFISLAIEQQTNNDRDDNFGVKPLPNLETRLVAANTLFLLNEAGGAFLSDPAKKIKAQLSANRERHFHATDYELKKACRKKDEQLRKQLADQLEEDGLEEGSAKKIAAWNPYDQNTAATWFDTEYMFGVPGDYGIVIGNPPYVDSENMLAADSQQREIIKRIYKTARGNWDLYIPFIERGMLLANRGILSFIVPNKLMSQPYAKVSRAFLAARRFIEIRDYSHLEVFEAAVNPITFVVTGNTDYDKMAKAVCMDTLEEPGRHQEVSADFFQRNDDWSPLFAETGQVSVLQKINSAQGFCAGRFHNPATVSDAYNIKDIMLNSEDCPESKKFLNSGTIDRYVNFWGMRKARYIGEDYLFPRVKDSDIACTLSAKRVEESNAAKIIIANMTYRLEACLDSNAEFIAGKSTVIYMSGTTDLKVMLAILNSKLASFWYRLMFKGAQTGEGLAATKDRLSRLRIPEICDSQKSELVRLADEILADKAGNPSADTSQCEKEIDDIVYDLYGLTGEEIALVEDSI